MGLRGRAGAVLGLPQVPPGTSAGVVHTQALGRSALYMLYVDMNQPAGPLSCTESLLTISCSCTGEYERLLLYQRRKNHLVGGTVFEQRCVLV